MATMKTERTARKPHECATCGQPIKPGQRYIRWACTPWDDEVNQGPRWWVLASHLDGACPSAPRFSPADNSLAASVWRAVSEHPQPVCTDFTRQGPPAEFWCDRCGWNEPLHADEEFRRAVAAELDRLNAAGADA